MKFIKTDDGYKPDVFCCSDMEEAYNDRFIHIGEYDNFSTADKELNISKCYAYPEGPVWQETKIEFCPFCAEKIKFEGK